MSMVAALYVETDGAYFGLPHVDPWDIGRDARQYKGPHPIIAHPPCQRWGRDKTKIRNSTPDEFRDVLISMVRP